MLLQVLCTYLCIRIYVNVFMYMYLCICIYVYVFMYMYLCICIYVLVCLIGISSAAAAREVLSDIVTNNHLRNAALSTS